MMEEEEYIKFANQGQDKLLPKLNLSEYHSNLIKQGDINIIKLKNIVQVINSLYLCYKLFYEINNKIKI